MALLINMKFLKKERGQMGKVKEQEEGKKKNAEYADFILENVCITNVLLYIWRGQYITIGKMTLKNNSKNDIMLGLTVRMTFPAIEIIQFVP